MSQYVVLSERLLLALIFGFACLAKGHGVTSFRQFGESVHRMTRMAPRLSMAFAVGVVLCEGVTAVLLATPLYRWGFAASLMLLTVFTGVAVRAVLSGAVSECRCFGGRGSSIGVAMVVRNVALMTFPISGLLLHPGTGGFNQFGLVAALALGAAIGIFFIRYYDTVVRWLIVASARSGQISKEV